MHSLSASPSEIHIHSLLTDLKAPAPRVYGGNINERAWIFMHQRDEKDFVRITET